MSIMCLTIFSLVYLATFIGASYGLEERDSCATGYTLCSPPGASTTVTPQIGDSAFPNLFADIVHSSLPASKRSLSERQTASLCCIASLDCLTMSGLSLPFCYDRFTTNYFLPDGSFGTVVGGAYTSATKDTANLETGDYTLANGMTGNIYSANEAAKPDTAALPLPSQFTASGVGTAIPASALGDEVTLTFTTTFPQTTIPATTRAATTVVSLESLIFASVITTSIVSDDAGQGGSTSQTTFLATITTTASTPVSTVETTIVVSPTTIPATTVPAIVSVVTTIINTASNPALFGTDGVTATGATPAATTTKKKSTGISQKMAFSGDTLLVLGMCGLAGLVLL